VAQAVSRTAAVMTTVTRGIWILRLV